MNIEFSFLGLTLAAKVIETPYIPAQTRGKPEDCYPAEGGELEFKSLTCDGKDAMFLLNSKFLRDQIGIAAYEELDRLDKEAA